LLKFFLFPHFVISISSPNMRVLAMLPMVAAVSQTRERIEGMQTTLRNIAEKAKSSGKIEEGVKVVVQSFMDTMNDTLVAALIAETEANQKLLDDAAAAILKCRTDREDEFAGLVTTAAGVRDASREALASSKTCGASCTTGRGAALVQGKSTPSGHNYTYDIMHHWGNTTVTLSWDPTDPTHKKALAKSVCDESSLCQGECDCHVKMTSKCAELDGMVKRFNGETTAEPDFCDGTEFPKRTKPDVHPHTVDIDSREYYSWEAEKMATDPLYKWFSEMESFVDENVQKYKTCREGCHLLRWVHQHRMFETHTKQKEFERDFCAWAHSIDVTCSKYEACYARTMKVFVDYKTAIETEETQFKLQQQALECALCYGAQLLADSTDLSACDRESECKRCDPLCIDYPTPHDELACTEEAKHRPCSEEFTAAEYGCFADHCPPNDCLPCST